MVRNYSSTAPETQLSAPVSGSATVIPASSVSGFPAVPFTLVLDPSTVYEELVTVTSVAGLNLTVVRGEDGTSGVPHQTGAVVRHVVSARDLRESQQHIAASQDVHGVGAGSSMVGTETAQTLKNKTIDGTNDVSSDALPTEVSVARLRLTSASDASDSSTTHALQIGDTAGLNVRYDTNEIVALNAGAGVTLGVPHGLSVFGFSPTSSGHLTPKDYVDGLWDITSPVAGVGLVSGFTTTDVGVSIQTYSLGPLRWIRYSCRRVGPGSDNLSSVDFQFGNVGEEAFQPPVSITSTAKIWANSGQSATISGTAELRPSGEVWMIDTNSRGEFTLDSAPPGSTSIYADFFFLKP